MGNAASAPKPELDQLREAFDGNVLLPNEPGFGKACETWHTNPLLDTPRKPRLVLQPRTTHDVVLAVNYARNAGLDLSVKSGGHSPNNACVVEDGMTLDLGLMRGVYVDPAARTAVAEGGCRLGDVDSETALHNLGVPLGHAPVTGMGLVLNGGIGVASKVFGPASDHILELTVVVADGSVLVISKDSHPELFWAMCGVGSAYGVCTKIKLQLHDVSDCVGGNIMVPYSRDNFQTAARWLLNTGWPKPEFCCTVVIVTPPGSPGPVLAFMIMYFGKESKEDKIKFLDPIRTLPVISESFGQLSYFQTQSMLKPMVRQHVPGRYEVTEQLVDRVVDEIVDKIPPWAAPSVFTFDWWASPAIKESRAPLGFKNKEVGMLMLVDWMDPKYTKDGIAFAKHCRESLASMHTDDGIYANADYISKDMVTESGVARRVGGSENLARLREVKMQYDPDNLFRNHHFTGLMDTDKAL